jgi:hypothetical protein
MFMGITYDLGQGSPTSPLSATAGNPSSGVFTLPTGVTITDSDVWDWTQYAPFTATAWTAGPDGDGNKPGDVGWTPTYSQASGAVNIDVTTDADGAPHVLVCDQFVFNEALYNYFVAVRNGYSSDGPQWIRFDFTIKGQTYSVWRAFYP